MNIFKEMAAESNSNHYMYSRNHHDSDSQTSESMPFKQENVCGEHTTDDNRNRILRMFKSSYSCWDTFLRASNHFSHHLNSGKLAQRSYDCYEHYCQSQMAYHTHMANVFHSEWLRLQKQTGKELSEISRSPSTCHYDPVKFNKELNGRDLNVQMPKRRTRTKKSSKRSRLRRNKKKSPRRKQCHIEVHLSDQNSGGNQIDLIFDGTDSTEFEMEITEDMLEFFTKSARHRQERDSKKRNPSGCDVFFEFSEVSSGKKRPTTEAPKERPDQQRNEEMKELYGTGSAMVHGMETAMQLTFERNLARQQPQLWPALPINFNCDATKRSGIYKTVKTAIA